MAARAPRDRGRQRPSARSGTASRPARERSGSASHSSAGPRGDGTPLSHPPDRWPLVGAASMQALDAHSIGTWGIPGEVLMESAGRAVVEALLARWPAGADAEVVVVCGGGNNGGDGLVVARHLHLLGCPVRAVLVGDPGRLRGDAAANYRRAQAVGVRFEGSRWRLPQSGFVVDAVFGTGLTRRVEGAAAAAIRRIEQARGPRVVVVAVDLPSGIDADTGEVHGVAVTADCTIGISLPKLGHALEPGRSHSGEVQIARIGIADAAPGVRPEAELWTPAAAAARLPARPRHGHKGSFGHVLVVAGSEGKTGAAALAAAGAGRAGAGLVTVACPAGLNDILEVKCTEAMTAPVADTPERALAAAAEGALAELAAERDVVACGPGVGRSDETVKLVRALAARVQKPLVLDADGLFAFAAEPGVLKRRGAPTILTPHPGEAARLLGLGAKGAAEVNRDRLAAAGELAEVTGSVVVLKGAATVVAAPAAGEAARAAPAVRKIVNATGGPTLGTGGTGDVLTGVVAALLAQGSEPLDAAALAVYLHGAAADRLSRRRGRAGVLAEDLAAELPATAEALWQQTEHDTERAHEQDGTHTGRARDWGRSPGTAASPLLLPFPGS